MSRDFVAGRWGEVSSASASDTWEQRSPADLDDVTGIWMSRLDDVDRAVEAAREAQPAWSRLSLADRIRAVETFGIRLAERRDALVDAVVREVGKPVWEARAEVDALQSKIRITIDESLPLVADWSRDGLGVRYRPLGVLAVLGPFNFPLHLPHGHVVPALLTGNAVVLKPSDKAPLCAQVYAEAAEAAGFPPGVFNLVQGRADVGARLSAHAAIDGVLFTGSVGVGQHILAANAHRPGRMLALELGGKNTAIVLDDPPFDKTVADLLYAALVTSGQRCTATSRVVVQRGIADRLVAELVRRIPEFVTGHPRTDVFRGPLIQSEAVERFLGATERARAEGVDCLVPPTRLDAVPGEGRSFRGHYVTPSMHLIQSGRPITGYETEEYFGPDLAIRVIDTVEEAIEAANATSFGLAMSVFGGAREEFEAIAPRLQAGVVSWNLPTAGASSRLPFGGVKDSGNHRPSALFSPLYCTFPQALHYGSSAPGPRPAGVRAG